MNGRAGNWLGSAAATAAGVAGGALLAQGISHLFSPGRGGWLANAAGAPTGHATVNNYFANDEMPLRDDCPNMSWV